MTELSDQPFVPLAEGFDSANREQWVREVEKNFKGRSINDALHRSTYEGVALQPIYSRDEKNTDQNINGYTKTMSELRRETSSRLKYKGWDIRQAYFDSNPEEVNVDIRNDIKGGVNSLALKVTHNPTRSASDGIIVSSVADLEKLFLDVNMENTSITFTPNHPPVVLASMFIALLKKRNINLPDISGGFGADPLGVLARKGRLKGTMEEHLISSVKLAAWNIRNMDGMRAFSVDTTGYHAAGVTETEDLAIALSTAVTYLRSMTSSGMTVDEAFKQIAFTISVGTDVFQVIAKLRAARFLWARIAEVCKVKNNVGAMVLNAVTATRILSGRDISVNMLRSTSACFSAGVGGADSITLYPHTHVLGFTDSAGRRITRNTQNILINESSLGHVSDPAGGSHYAEYLTNEFANRSWDSFQTIESNGGILAQILEGKIQKMAAKSWRKRQNNLAGHNELLTGVSSFPDLDESTEISIDFKKDDASILSDEDAVKDYELRIDDLSTFTNAAAQAASADNLLSVFSEESTMCDALDSHRLGEAYESLRDLSDRWLDAKGRRPQAVLACLGAPSEFTQRVVFSKNYLAVGGIKAIEACVDIATIHSVITESKADLVVVCSSDKVYLESLNSIIETLRLNNTRLIVVAGHPGNKEEGLKGLGVDLFIYSGDNMLKTLLEIAENIGMVE